MKRIVYSVLLVFLMSCGESHPLNYVNLRIGNASPKNYTVRNVTETSVFLMPEDPAKDTIEVYPLSDLGQATIQRNTALYGWIGGLAVFSATAATALVIEKANGVRGDGFEGSIAFAVAPIGAFIGCKAADGMKDIDLQTPEGRKLLKERAESK
ncbi:MAG: hypothetical protein ABI778_01540 [Ignavibacteriota bacterium]